LSQIQHRKRQIVIGVLPQVVKGSEIIRHMRPALALKAPPYVNVCIVLRNGDPGGRAIVSRAVKRCVIGPAYRGSLTSFVWTVLKEQTGNFKEIDPAKRHARTTSRLSTTSSRIPFEAASHHSAFS
jgi:hypothetical protein